MVHPNVETKWQLDKIRELVNQIDKELDEADFRINQSEELRDQEDKREIDRKALASLAQNACKELEDVDMADERAVHDSMVTAIKAFAEIIKELNK